MIMLILMFSWVISGNHPWQQSGGVDRNYCSSCRLYRQSVVVMLGRRGNSGKLHNRFLFVRGLAA